MSRRVFRGLRTLRNKSTLDSIFSSWSTSSLGWVLFFFNVKEREFKISFSPVYCCFGQILVHVGALLLRRLLHHSALFCINILGQDMDRWEHVDFSTNGIHPSILIKWTIWNFTLESKVFSQDSGSCELCGWWQFRTSCSTSTSSRPPPPSGELPSTCSWRTLPPPCLGPTARLWPWPSQLSPQIFWYNCDQKDILAQLKSTVVTLATHILNVTYLWQWHR